VNIPFCDACGVANRDGARFCRACGAQLPDESGDASAPSVAAPASEVPESLRRAFEPEFEFQRRLGRGGMGVVWLAREAALERLVAIKVLRRDDEGDRSMEERFLREARMAARLRHRNVVSVHAVGRRDDIAYFTMDYIDGETLSQRASSRGALPVAEARRIMLETCEGVRHAHRHGIVHRDIKPSNVMLDGEDHVVVLDFGLARPDTGPSLTVSGAVHGTPEYLSPEQVEGGRATLRSDIYALGLTWWLLLTGRPLVDVESATGALAMHVTSDFEGVVLRDSRVPADARRIVASMVARDPARRHASLDDVIEAISALGAGDAEEHAAPTRQVPRARGGAAEATKPAPMPGASPQRKRVRSGSSGSGARDASSPGRARTRERLNELLDKLERKDPPEN